MPQNERAPADRSLWLRVGPFFGYVALTSLQGRLGPGSQYWIYLLKTVLAGGFLWSVRRQLPEMRWSASGPALAAGLIVFLLWVGLDPFYPKFMQGHGLQWNPPVDFGEGSALSFLLIATRIAGSTLVVPPLEEIFYRSFLYRYFISERFLTIPLAAVKPAPFLITSCIFGFAHHQWLPGILCGMIYQWLACRRGDLGEAITAHAITNFCLGVWVVTRDAWRFW